ncbi:hypothetical protein BASA50_010834 [Batrachochytrium salamandrivorans]|uniref:Uncharacterized protein n=1 Tax=Batrachochytrium salamandrivorans TaxID=1357716 RepID=A0ABQ8EXG2_9FUNG|nr:hypothetical protein BASA62_004287 [Batrachochytrium salamandrivorans]KAH6580814.1 hypothetical protein BASA61_009397 [Batrachochytrium salamandrivorans]KAH6581819.1 hypothetical protein BASA60_002213 [Batrachochytrium salamandrivorans]KAH6588283.1 hypothetical protein BASA50_010834 [Batrachochytrium salamandrivorans]
MRPSNLQTCNNEIVKALELAHGKRQGLQKVCDEQESKCQELRSLIHQFQHDLAQAEARLAEANLKKGKYDKIIKAIFD